jgi:hypothetical protein
MPIPSRAELPKDFYELKNVAVEFPRLSPDNAASCPVTMRGVLDYLHYEAPGGEESGSSEVMEFQPEFLRTALVEQTKYWIWRFADVDGNDCYVTVSLSCQGECVTGYDESFGFSPEQFILADYYELD